MREKFPQTHRGHDRHAPATKASPPKPAHAAPVRIATRGSALALAQARSVQAALCAAHPGWTFELCIIKTTGDQLQAQRPVEGESLPKGLFTKELELALLNKEADLAVHSLKDVPTELPDGLVLTAVGARADVRDVLLYRDRDLVRTRVDPNAEWRPGDKPVWGSGIGCQIKDLPAGGTVATSSTRRAALVQALRPDLTVVPIRGNVGTRMSKIAAHTQLSATLLAHAGLNRLHYDISPKGFIRVDPRLPAAARSAVTPPPEGLRASLLPAEEFLPAPGQGAVAIEIRAGDTETTELCQIWNHTNTFASVTAERSLLRSLGGGCLSPVGAWARVVGHQLVLDAVYFKDGNMRRSAGRQVVREAELLGSEVAALLNH